MAPEALAILSSCSVALSALILSELRGRLSLVQVSRWQMLAATVFTGLASLALGGWRSVSLDQVVMLLFSSAAGIVIAGSAYIAALHKVGPRITTLLFSLMAPITLVLGYLFLGETISRVQAGGVMLVLVGIALAIGMPRRFLPDGETRPAMPALEPSALPLGATAPAPKFGPLKAGIVLGVIAALFQAIGALLARPVMAAGADPFTAMAIRAGFAAAFFVGLSALRVGKPAPVADKRAILLVICASFFGATLGMSLLMAALKTGNAGIVVTLSSITPVLILPLVWITGREVPPPMAWVGAILALCGTALISIR